MLRASRSPALLRRAAAAHSRHQVLRRLLHEDSSRGSDFPPLTLNTPHIADPRFGMDLTRAPGYEVAADEDPPLVPSQKVVDFAVRHARLSAAQVDQADGYIWVGNVLYPSGIAPDPDIAFSWEIVHDDDADLDDDTHAAAHEPARDDEAAKDASTEASALADASNRQFSTQARRVKKERVRTTSRRAKRLSKKRSSRTSRDFNKEDEDC